MIGKTTKTKRQGLPLDALEVTGFCTPNWIPCNRGIFWRNWSSIQHQNAL